MNGEARVRLDKWLWAARFYKTRTLAAQAIDAGQVRVGGERVKTAHAVRTGERVSVRKSGFVWDVTVTGLSDRRGGAAEAALLYQEDEASIADFLVRGLTEQGYAVDLARDGAAALDLLAVASIDVVVLDVMLPRVSGLDVCRTMRDRGDSTPVLMLTARDAVEDRVRGLDTGADDYLVKPFAFSELVARIRALSRREPAASDRGAQQETGRIPPCRRLRLPRSRYAPRPPK